MDSTVPRSRGVLLPQTWQSAVPKSGEILFEKQKFELITKTEQLSGIDLGIISVANFDEHEDNKPETFNTYVNLCKSVIEQDGADTDFLLICGSGSFLRTRAAVIAAKECTAKARLFPLLQVDSQLQSDDGWAPLAQMLTLQALGCDGVLIDCEDKCRLGTLLQDIAPYVTIPVAIWCTDVADIKGMLPYVTHLVLKDTADRQSLLAEVRQLGFFEAEKPPMPPCTDLLAVSNGKVWFLDSYVDIGEAVECDASFSQNLLLAEVDEAPVSKVSIRDENGLDIFETEQYMIKEPVAIDAEDGELFRRAVRMFCGIALYDGTGYVDEALLRELNRKYGLIIL